MRLKLFFVSVFFVLNCFLSVVFAQKQYTISGYVEDAKTGERLIGANVYNAKDYVGTSTNVYGFFSLTLPQSAADSVFFTVSFVGYTSYQKKIWLNEDQNLTIKLSDIVELQAVEIKASKSEEAIQERSQMSSLNLPIKQIKSLPAFMGEVDIIKALQLTPGVHGGSEGNSGLYVRGGGPDQNLILLDGVPVYNAAHLFGFFSVFNSDAVSNVELIKGGFPARYGGRLSSVLDIRMKEGNMQKFSGSASIGLIASRLTLEAPINKGKTSFIFSARRTYIDILLRPLILAQSNGDGYGGYYFYDLNAKINHKFSDKDRLYISGYFGDDRFYFNYTDQYSSGKQTANGDLGWGNGTGVVRWNHIWNKKLFSNFTTTYTRYKLNTSAENNSTQNNESTSFKALYFSSIRDYTGKIDFDYVPNPMHFVRFGASATDHYFKPGATQLKLDDTSPNSYNIDTLIKDEFVHSLELDTYIEDDFKIGKRLKANIGLHGSGFKVQNKFYTSLQPRFSSRFLLNETMSLKASYAQMTQFIHLLSTSSALSLPTDLWVPVTANVKPQISHQVAVGWAFSPKIKNVEANTYEFSIEAYYKKMLNLIDYKDGANYQFSSKGWEEQVETGTGETYGTEFFLQKKEGKFTGWIGYTLAYANRQFENINFGKKYPYRYDRRHDISVVGIYRPKKNIELSGTWVYGTGNAVTLPIAQYNTVTQVLTSSPYSNNINYYGGRNAYRMGAYHRFDASITFIKQKQHGERRWNISVYNAYNRKNPFFLLLSETNGQKVFKQISIFPVLPSISWTRSW